MIIRMFGKSKCAAARRRMRSVLLMAIAAAAFFTPAFAETPKADTSGTAIEAEPSVTVSPAIISVFRGRTQQFTAAVTGIAGDKSVRWEVSGNTSPRTTITADGLLTVAADETGKSLTVTATASANPGVSASLTARRADVLWYTADPSALRFTISTAEDLAGLAHIVNGTWGGTPAQDNFAGKTVALSANIDISQYGNWTPIGGLLEDMSLRWLLEKGEDALLDRGAAFSGTFDGGGFAINGLTISPNKASCDERKKPCGQRLLGLFGIIVSGAVENLGLTGVNIEGGDAVGGIAGYLGSGGSITNCHTAGSVRSINKGSDYIGGLVGAVKSSDISGSYSVAEVKGYDNAGGIAGIITDSSSVVNCYYSGTVSGSEYVGGVAGAVAQNSRVASSYSAGRVQGLKYAGGIAGRLRNSGAVTGSYSIAAVAVGQDYVGGIAGWLAKRSVISDCAVLNPELTVNRRNTHAYAGRVAGDSDVGDMDSDARRSRIKSNAAYANMKIPAARPRKSGARDRRILTSDQADAVYMKMSAAWAHKGKDISAAQIISDGTIGKRFTGENGWTVENGRLPGLFGKTVEMPEHLTK